MTAIHASRRNLAIGRLSGAEIASMLTDDQRAAMSVVTACPLKIANAR